MGGVGFGILFYEEMLGVSPGEETRIAYRCGVRKGESIKLLGIERWNFWKKGFEGCRGEFWAYAARGITANIV